jgi:hypothetical protein
MRTLITMLLYWINPKRQIKVLVNHGGLYIDNARVNTNNAAYAYKANGIGDYGVYIVSVSPFEGAEVLSTRGYGGYVVLARPRTYDIYFCNAGLRRYLGCVPSTIYFKKKETQL